MNVDCVRLTSQKLPQADAVAEGTDQHCGVSWVSLLYGIWSILHGDPHYVPQIHMPLWHAQSNIVMRCRLLT